MSESREVLKAISNQLLEDYVNAPIGSRYRCVPVPDWWISKSNDEIIITGNWGDEPLPKHPNWLGFDVTDEDEFWMSIPSNSHMYECIGLLYEVWKSSQDSYNTLQQNLSESLLNLRNRWLQMGDPINKEKQMRLIGEIIPLVESIKIVGQEALDAWDVDGRALYDIEAESWIIEAKATRSEPESVWISHPAQVDWRGHKPIVLAVTRLNSVHTNDLEGLTFPEIINEYISTLSDEMQNQIRLILLTVGYTPELNGRYSTKWLVHGTRYIPIHEESPVIDCEILEGLPREVLDIKYQLETANMDSIDLKSFLGV